MPSASQRPGRALMSENRSLAIEAVIFDLGETLLDSGGISPDFVRDEAESDFGAVHRYLVEQGYPLPECAPFVESAIDAFRRQVGVMRETGESVHMASIIDEALGTRGIAATERDIDISVLITFLRSHTHRRLHREAIPTLRRLRARGIPTALISNTLWPRWCQDRMLEELGIRVLLHPRTFSADSAYAKPHTSIFADVLRALGVEPDRAVYVGDHIVPDVVGAQGSGMRAVLLEVPYRTESHPHVEPDARITSLDQVIGVIDGWESDPTG